MIKATKFIHYDINQFWPDEEFAAKYIYRRSRGRKSKEYQEAKNKMLREFKKLDNFINRLDAIVR